MRSCAAAATRRRERRRRPPTPRRRPARRTAADRRHGAGHTGPADLVERRPQRDRSSGRRPSSAASSRWLTRRAGAARRASARRSSSSTSTPLGPPLSGTSKRPGVTRARRAQHPAIALAQRRERSRARAAPSVSASSSIPPPSATSMRAASTRADPLLQLRRSVAAAARRRRPAAPAGRARGRPASRPRPVRPCRRRPRARAAEPPGAGLAEQLGDPGVDARLGLRPAGSSADSARHAALSCGAPMATAQRWTKASDRRGVAVTSGSTGTSCRSRNRVAAWARSGLAAERLVDGLGQHEVRRRRRRSSASAVNCTIIRLDPRVVDRQADAPGRRGRRTAAARDRSNTMATRRAGRRR